MTAKTDIDAEARALLKAEDAARLERARQTTAERHERERVEQERRAAFKVISRRLTSMDPAALTALRQSAEDALAAYATAIVAWDAELSAIAGDAAGLHDLGATVEPYTRTVRIGSVQRSPAPLQKSIAEVALAALRPRVSAGFISLDSPPDA